MNTDETRIWGKTNNKIIRENLCSSVAENKRQASGCPAKPAECATLIMRAQRQRDAHNAFFRRRNFYFPVVILDDFSRHRQPQTQANIASGKKRLRRFFRRFFCKSRARIAHLDIYFASAIYTLARDAHGDL